MVVVSFTPPPLPLPLPLFGLIRQSIGTIRLCPLCVGTVLYIQFGHRAGIPVFRQGSGSHANQQPSIICQLNKPHKLALSSPTKAKAFERDWQD